MKRFINYLLCLIFTLFVINVVKAEESVIDIKVSYDNYKDIEPYNYFGNNYELYVEYFNSNNPVNINIQQKGLEDKDYKLKIEISSWYSNSLVYEFEQDINGKILENGYDHKLNLDLSDRLYNKEMNADYDNQDVYFNVKVSIDDNYSEFNFFYLYKSTIKSSLLLSNGQLLFCGQLGDGAPGWTLEGYYPYYSVFDKNDSLIIHFDGEDFLDNEEYTYTIESLVLNDEEYVNMQFDERMFGNRYELLTEGTIKGNVLNRIGINYKAINSNNDKRIGYRIIVKKGNTIIYCHVVEINQDITPTFSTYIQSLTKKIYRDKQTYYFVVTKNYDINQFLRGIGFVDNDNYTLSLSIQDYNVINETVVQNEIYNSSMSITGEKINNELISFTIPKEIFNNLGNYTANISAYNENTKELSSIYVDLKVVDIKDFFANKTYYTIDSVSDLIKGISKNTTIDTFKQNIELKNNGSIKIFDNSGVHEQNDKVGTGMKVRLYDEFEQEILDVDVVVKGDVSGDGDVTITDLVKMNQHLEDVKRLDGIYELAGDITDTGTLEKNDVLEISNDVAGNKDVK